MNVCKPRLKRLKGVICPKRKTVKSNAEILGFGVFSGRIDGISAMISSFVDADVQTQILIDAVVGRGGPIENPNNISNNFRRKQNEV